MTANVTALRRNIHLGTTMRTVFGSRRPLCDATTASPDECLHISLPPLKWRRRARTSDNRLDRPTRTWRLKREQFLAALTLHGLTYSSAGRSGHFVIIHTLIIAAKARTTASAQRTSRDASFELFVLLEGVSHTAARLLQVTLDFLDLTLDGHVLVAEGPTR